MENKKYSSYAEIERDLEILKLEKDRSVEILPLSAGSHNRKEEERERLTYQGMNRYMENSKTRFCSDTF